MESEFALEESIQIGRIDGLFRFSPKHELSMSYYDLNRSGTRPTQRDINFGDAWRFVGDIEWFDVAAGDLQGTFMDALVAFEHDTFEKIGLGFGLNRFRFDVEAGGENLKGEVQLKFDAAVFYFRGAFGTVD